MEQSINIQNNYIYLSQLPSDNKYRNTPLKHLKVECINIHNRVQSNPSLWKIKEKTFNQLGDVWHKSFEWKIYN